MSTTTRAERSIAALVEAHDGVQVLPTSFAQRRFWMLDQFDEESAYTLPVGVRLRGPLDAGALHGALNLIVERHEALRTVFALEGDEPVQVVLPNLRIPLPIEDLGAVPAESREAEVRARADANANAPFDLATGPLLRASLLRLSDAEHVLLLSLHHIIADGWSIGVFFDELAEGYTALAAGVAAVLPPLPLQYPDFAVWQRRAMENPAAARQMAYWTEHLRDLSPIELPTDRPRPPVQTLNGAHRELTIDRNVAEGIRSLARREGATANVGFLAAFFALLHRYTGQTDLVVGSPTSGRRRPEVEPLIGLFLNTVAIRADVTAETPFVDLLRRVRDSATGAYANEEVPFEQVVDAVQPTRDRSRSPIFQVAFQLLDTLAREVRLPGLTASRVSGAKDSAKFELTLMLHAAPNGGLRAVLEYNTDLFDAPTIERMLRHYATLLEGVARDPAAPVGRLPLMHGEEYALVTDRWNPPPTPIPEWTLPERVLQLAIAGPGAVAVRAGGMALTYGDLASRSAALARRISDLGIGPGDRVAVCMDRTTELVVALLAVHRTGAAYVPLDAEHPPERLAYILEDVGVRAVLTDAASAGHLPQVGVPVVLLDDSELSAGAGSGFTAPAIDPESPAYVIYTSGSTGRPKGVVVPHRALTNFLASMAEQPGLAPGDALVAVTTVAFDIAGLELWLPLVTGARVELASREVAADGMALRALVEAVTESVGDGSAMLQATPATWSLLLEAGWNGAPRVVMLCGGEAWPPRLAESLLARGGALWNVYGPTETTIWSTRHHVTRADQVPLGEPLANTTLLVLEPTGEPAPLGVPGELCIGGAGLALGYHGRPDLTAERFVAHPRHGRIYRTGDRARRRGDGGLQYLGRLDEQIKLRGYRVELGEIESVLAVQPGVKQAVVALRHDAGAPRLVAYVVLTPDGGEAQLRLDALVAPLRRALPEYMVPTSIVALDALPLSPSGKVDRRRLPAPAEDAWAGAQACVAPRTPLEQEIAAIWAAVLVRDRVGVDDDFFALGGHSLLAMRVVARLADAVPVRLTIGALFDARTVAGLAALVVQRRAEQGGSEYDERILPRGSDGPAPLSQAQELIWLYEQMTPGTAAYNLPMARRVRGPLNVPALGRSLDALVARHESLRTTFVESNGEARQVVAPPAPATIERYDLTTHPPELRHAEAERLLQEAASRPFDLSAGTHPRVVLVAVAPEESLLLVVVHHIVFDGASAGVLLTELAAVYAAGCEGRTPELPPLPIQFADVAAWERRELTGTRLEPTLAYWRDQLKNAPSGIDLPTDFPRTAERVGPGARHAALLSLQTRDGVRALATAHGVTPFVVLMAGFLALLHRYSGQADVVVGTAVAGRERAGTAGVVGYLANTLALRGRFEGDPTFAELLDQVRNTTLRALDHQDVRYEQLVRDLRVGQPPAEHTLFRVMFTLQDSGVSVPRLGDAVLEPLGLDLGAAKFDLTVSAAEVAGGIEIVAEYRSDLFSERTIAAMMGHFETLLNSAARAPQLPASGLALLSPVEEDLLLRVWNATEVSYPAGATLVSMFAEQVGRTPNAPAVADDEGVLSYRELEAAASALAHRLASAGAGRGSLVGVLADRSVGLVVALLAVLKAGAAYVPFDPEYPSDRLRFMIEDAAVGVVVTEARRTDLVTGLVGTGVAVVLLDAAAPCAGEERRTLAAPGPEDVAYMIYTSGSTGRPKGALNAHAGIVNRLLWMQSEYRLTERDVVLQKTPFSFDVSVWEFFWPLISGARLVMARPGGHRDTGYLAEVVAAQGVTVCHFVPSMLRAFLANPAAAECRTLRDVMASGEALTPDLVAAFYTALPSSRLHNLYGPTECAVDVTFWPCPVSSTPPATVPIGPVANTQVYVLDDRRQPVPIGVPGELYLAGTQVGLGYHGRPDLTAERFLPDPFARVPGARMYRTGDRARWRAEGVIEYLGRLDFQVKVRGFRIELGEIETALAEHPLVSTCAVHLRVDGPEPRVVAYYVAAGGAPGRGELRAWLASRLPEFMVPAAFVELPALPLTANGKVDRGALPSPQYAPPAEDLPPQGPVEEVVASVWRQALQVERVGRTTSFFELGGHSLLVTRVVAALAKLLRTQLPIRAMFDAPTVQGIAAALIERETAPGQTERVAQLVLKLQAQATAVDGAAHTPIQTSTHA